MESKGEVSLPMVRSCVGVYGSQLVVHGQEKIQGRRHVKARDSYRRAESYLAAITGGRRQECVFKGV
jgi:hypothetical protein